MSKTAQELARTLLPKLEILAHVQYLLQHPTPEPDAALLHLADESLHDILKLVQAELPEGSDASGIIPHRPANRTPGLA
jgi:hypothetical protein